MTLPSIFRLVSSFNIMDPKKGTWLALLLLECVSLCHASMLLPPSTSHVQRSPGTGQKHVTPYPESFLKHLTKRGIERDDRTKKVHNVASSSKSATASWFEELSDRLATSNLHPAAQQRTSLESESAKSKKSKTQGSPADPSNSGKSGQDLSIERALSGLSLERPLQELPRLAGLKGHEPETSSPKTPEQRTRSPKPLRPPSKMRRVKSFRHGLSSGQSMNFPHVVDDSETKSPQQSEQSLTLAQRPKKRKRPKRRADEQKNSQSSQEKESDDEGSEHESFFTPTPPQKLPSKGHTLL